MHRNVSRNKLNLQTHISSQLGYLLKKKKKKRIALFISRAATNKKQIFKLSISQIHSFSMLEKKIIGWFIKIKTCFLYE